jgi:acyl-CoA-dependent ceramide synthase
MASEKEVLSRRESLTTNPRNKVRTRRVFAARKIRRKDESVFNILCAWFIEHQIGIAINLLCLLGLAHLCFPRARRRTRKFFDMSYHHPDTGMYGSGWDDMYFVSFWIVLFTGVRASVLDYVLKPLAGLGGISSQKLRTRFAEQAWLVLYCSASWGIGIVSLLSLSPKNY